MDSEEIYDPRDVAKRLGLSGAGLRRIARIYEDTYGPLRRDPPDSEHGKRVWTVEAVERLERARALVHAGRAGSIEAALWAGDAGEDVDPHPTHRKPVRGDIAALVEEIRAMRVALEENNRRLAAIEHQTQLQGDRSPQLEAPTSSEGPPDGPESAESRSGRVETPQEPETSTERSWWRRIWG